VIQQRQFAKCHQIHLELTFLLYLKINGSRAVGAVLSRGGGSTGEIALTATRRRARPRVRHPAFCLIHPVEPEKLPEAKQAPGLLHKVRFSELVLLTGRGFFLMVASSVGGPGQEEGVGHCSQECAVLSPRPCLLGLGTEVTHTRALGTAGRPREDRCVLFSCLQGGRGPGVLESGECLRVYGESSAGTNLCQEAPADLPGGEQPASQVLCPVLLCACTPFWTALSVLLGCSSHPGH
jgi:hypothetical protein